VTQVHPVARPSSQSACSDCMEPRKRCACREKALVHHPRHCHGCWQDNMTLRFELKDEERILTQRRWLEE
jgi:predicted amidophosphoribosyltransferase